MVPEHLGLSSLDAIDKMCQLRGIRMVRACRTVAGHFKGILQMHNAATHLPSELDTGYFF